MLLTDVYHVPTPISLVVIIGILAVAVIASIRAERNGVTPPGVQEERDVTAPPEGWG
jgi:hypothetical protein